jgi:hypothetical protein
MYRMDDLYNIPGPPITYNDKNYRSDPVFMIIVTICVIGQVIYILCLLGYKIQTRRQFIN